MTVGEIIYNRRKQLNLTLEDIGVAVGVSKSTVKKWESGFIANIKRDKISKLAEVLQLNPVVFINSDIAESEYYHTPDNIIPLPNTRKIPLLGTIACGKPILASENIDGEIDLPENIHADFALRCKGDSMIDARILDGDIVYIRQQPTVENGEIAAVLIDDEATLKRVYISGDTLTLIACNSKYQPFVYTGQQLEQIRILGKAVGFTSTIL